MASINTDNSPPWATSLVNQKVSVNAESPEEFYFAYGSNLWVEQVIRRTGPIDRTQGWPRRTTLVGYQFNFSMRSAEGEFFANIEPAENAVLGVLYRCPTGFLDSMDGYEVGYSRHEVLVTDENGQSWQATTYVADEFHRSSQGTPSAEYLQRILRGAAEFNFPETYLRSIEIKGTPTSG